MQRLERSFGCTSDSLIKAIKFQMQSGIPSDSAQPDPTSFSNRSTNRMGERNPGVLEISKIPVSTSKQKFGINKVLKSHSRIKLT